MAAASKVLGESVWSE